MNAVHLGPRASIQTYIDMESYQMEASISIIQSRARALSIQFAKNKH